MKKYSRVFYNLHTTFRQAVGALWLLPLLNCFSLSSTARQSLACLSRGFFLFLEETDTK